VKRRSFLIGTGSLAIATLLASCGNPNRDSLEVLLLKNSVPARVLSAFRKQLQQPANLDFTPTAQLQALFLMLQEWQQQSPPQDKDNGFNLPTFWKGNHGNNLPDLVTLGDYWLSEAIQQELIQPLDPAGFQLWDRLPQQWRNLVTRNAQGQADPEGQVWGAPYRWGTTAIAYRVDKFKPLGWTPQDWSDLWRPEIRDRISLLDSPRETIGLTLKKLGHSYQTANLDDVPDLEAELLALQQQVRLYSSDTYLQPLILGDTWLAVGWSSDLLPLVQRNPQIQAIVPQSGTALWADLWVQPAAKSPATADNPPSLCALAQQWIDFCWKSEVAVDLSLLSQATSPIALELNRQELPPGLQADPLLLPDAEAIARSEFLYPLAPDVADRYRQLWRKIRLS
jgi:putative spermidine/putrescine transport system substrate-binding protein